ncbi:MAG: GAF domain-containing protein, partial [Pseudanabaena sp.]
EKATKFEVNHDLNSNNVSKIPVLLDEEVLGWVIGAEKTKQVADFLNYIVKREFERKTLAADTLDNYREMSLLYTIASKMANCLDVKEIGSLVIEEASRLIKCTSASVMLHNQHDNSFEIIAAKGTAERIGSLKLAANQGIAGYVFSTGNPELVNDATKDPRYIVNEIESYALICAPIFTKDRILGVVNISNSEPISYTSKDLKLFTALVTQASGAIENALLHASKLQEERIKNNLERYL